MWRELARKLFQFSARLNSVGAAPAKTAKKVGQIPNAIFEKADPSAAPLKLTSPSGRVTAFLAKNGSLTYSVFLHKTPVILHSEMGVEASGQHLGENVLVGQGTSEMFSDIYETRGPSRTAADNHVRWLFPVRHVPSGLEYHLEIKLWDDGFGFRFIFPEGSKLLINGEDTTFRLPIDAVCWYQPDPVKLQDRTLMQMCRYLPSGTNFAYLATFDLTEGRGYAMLAEANLFDYPGAALRSNGKGHFGIRFWDSGDFLARDCVTPWRLVLLCETLDELVNCRVISNAAEPTLPMFDGADYIVPGRAAWSYFVNQKTSRSFETIMGYNPLAAEIDCRYSLIDSGWRDWALTETGAFKKVAKVVEDAEKYGVGIFIWKAVTMGPYLPLYRKWFFKQCLKAGVKGIKLDYIESETQFMINLYRSFLEEAAENGLMVLYHNPQKPTGLSRTYPNLMSMEAIRGMQCTCDPDDDTVLPFTRMVAGEADYTPLCFSVPKRRGDASVPHILATSVIYTSSFLTVSEHPANLEKSGLSDFVRALPTVWDETIALPQSRLGYVAVFARRSGEEWFIAALNSSRGKRDVTVSLDFLPENKSFSLELFADDPEGSGEALRRELNVTSRAKLVIPMQSGGGFAGRIVFRKEADASPPAEPEQETQTQFEAYDPQAAFDEE